jgi:hypothetical protein
MIGSREGVCGAAGGTQENEMWRNFFGADSSYHLARQRFVYKGLIPDTTLQMVNKS